MTRKKKRKINFKGILIFIIFIALIVLFAKYLLDMRIKNIVILNNNYYTDEYIIDKAKIGDYPKFLLLNTAKIKKTLMKEDLINDVKITKKWGGVLEININEKRVLYFIRSNNKYMTSDYSSYSLDDISGVPTLINYVTSDVEKDFVKRLNRIDDNIIKLVSEIEYTPNDFDQKRFLLYMNDGNLVYVTVTKLELLNKYVDIVKQLNNKNGILYLDSGNYFEIKE